MATEIITGIIIGLIIGIVIVNDKDSNEIIIDENESNILSSDPSQGTQTDSISKECSLFEYGDIVFDYKVRFATMFQGYKKNVGFEEYLNEIDYTKSEKISEYVRAILQSEDFAVMYFEKDLSSEEEKLMVQISEKYLEYLLDGKNRLLSHIRTGYQDAKNEINTTKCKNQESLLVDKDEALGELEQAKTELEYLIEYYVMPIIKNWEKELEFKKQDFQAEKQDIAIQTTSESTSIPNFTKSGKIGLKKGDWVKYQIDIVGGEGFFGTILNAIKQSYEDPNTGCTLSNFEWFKIEVIEINDKNRMFKSSNFCKGKENELDVIPLTGSDRFYFIPTDVKVGDVIGDSFSGELKVVGIEKRTYGGKTVDVVKIHSESEKTYDNGYDRSTTTAYYEKFSGILLEYQLSAKVVNAPLFGDDGFDMTIHAIDFNIPRLSGSGSDGGCLIATAAFGSELAPQVHLLREIRDNTVLRTQSGTSFMTAFNSFYYSFSPTVADWERQNPVFKETVKVAITPLLSSLSLLQYVDIDSEAEMLGYGIGIILLNIGMYFATPAILLLKFRLKWCIEIE